MKGRHSQVTAMQRLLWRQLGYPMHFCGRHECTFRLATLIERKIVVSTIGEYRPNMIKNHDTTMEDFGPPGSGMFYETFVFKVQSFTEENVPIIGEELDSERCATSHGAYELHKQMCMKFQAELNMGMHR